MFQSVWRGRGALGPSNHAQLTLVTPPTTDPVNLTLVKQNARITYSESEELLAFYVKAATQKVELYLRRALLTQTWDLTLDWGPAWVELPTPPLQTVVGVYTRDLANVEHLVPAATYFYDVASSQLSLTVGGVWPLHRARAGWRCRFTCGYGDVADAVPAPIREQILAMVTARDQNRVDAELSTGAKEILTPFRVVGDPLRMARGMSREARLE